MSERNVNYMKRIGTVGLCLVAVLASSSVAVSSSSAALPKWLPAGTTATFTGTSESATIKSGKHAIECTAVSLTGKITGENSTTSTVKFTGCKDTVIKEFCNSTEPEAMKSGEIVTKAQKGKLVYLKSGKKTPVGLLLEPEIGELFVRVSCVEGVVKESITGKIIGEVLPLNTMNTKGTVNFTLAAGSQRWTKVEEGAAIDKLIVFGEEATEQSEESIVFSESVGIEA
jgi:hypothetical protein